MAKDPAFLFYSEAFLAGVMTMTFEDRGKYITILAIMHQQGRMNEETIRFLVGSVSDNLRGKFRIDENGNWYNQKLEDEIEKRAKFAESRRENGKKGGRKPNGLPNGLPNAQPTENLPINRNINKDINENIGIGVQGEGNAGPPFDEVHRVFVQHGGTQKMAEHFFNTHSATGWMIRGNSVSRKWAYLVPNYIENWKQNDKNSRLNSKQRVDASAPGFIREPI